MKIYTTLDCIRLTKFEELLLTTIKGVLYDLNHASEGYYLHKDENKIITVKLCEQSKNMASFRIENTTKGLFMEVKKLIEPFSGGFVIQGGYHENDRTTSIILQRFEMKRENLSYYQYQGLPS